MRDHVMQAASASRSREKNECVRRYKPGLHLFHLTAANRLMNHGRLGLAAPDLLEAGRMKLADDLFRPLVPVGGGGLADSSIQKDDGAYRTRGEKADRRFTPVVPLPLFRLSIVRV